MNVGKPTDFDSYPLTPGIIMGEQRSYSYNISDFLKIRYTVPCIFCSDISTPRDPGQIKINQAYF